MLEQKNLTVTFGLVALLALVFIVSFMVAPKDGSEDGEAFGGTDGAVTELLEADGVEPWANPLLDLGSGELESGLFALQASIGAAVFGYAFGNLRGRSQPRKEDETDGKDSKSKAVVDK